MAAMTANLRYHWVKYWKARRSLMRPSPRHPNVRIIPVPDNRPETTPADPGGSRDFVARS
jgi:hypothetical protein